MLASVPQCGLGHIRQCLSPPPPHTSPHLGLDFVLGLCQAPSLSLSFTHTHTGVHPLMEAVGPGVEGPLAGQTLAWWSGDLGSCASPAAHTLRGGLRKDFSTLDPQGAR